MEQNNQAPQEGVENESNAAKRLRGLGVDMTDKIHDEDVSIKKGNFFGNLWYQHKWFIIIGSVLLFIAVYFAVNKITEPDYDMYVTYAGPLYMDSETRGAVKFSFEQVMADYDGNGEKLLNFGSITYQNAEQQKQTAEEMKEKYGGILHVSENYKALTSIQSQMLSGIVAIHLIDEALYDMYRGNMVKIEDVLGYSLDDGVLAGESGVYFKKTAFYRYMVALPEGKALKNLPDDTVLCILPELTTMDDELFDNSVALYKAILEFGK